MAQTFTRNHYTNYSGYGSVLSFCSHKLKSKHQPFGRIQDLTLPSPVPAGTLRSSVITFSRLRSATIARNVIHGLDLPHREAKATILRTAYQQPIQAHAIRDWISNHPKIVLPVIVFLLGTLTYTIFDPIRALCVQGKVSEWFDYRGLHKLFLLMTLSDADECDRIHGVFLLVLD